MCQKDMDRFGTHALHCHSGPETICRHNAVRDVFAQTARGAGLSPRVEAKKIMEDGQERLADVLLPGWPDGQTSAYNVTIISPFQVKYLQSFFWRPFGPHKVYFLFFSISLGRVHKKVRNLVFDQRY